MVDNPSIADRVELRRRDAAENAVLESVPPIYPDDILEIESSISSFGNFVLDLEKKPYLKSEIIDSVKKMATADSASARLIIWPYWPRPWPWPPIILAEPSIPDDELAALYSRLVEGEPDSQLRGTLRIFPAIAAGIALGYCCAKIYNKYARAGEIPASSDGVRHHLDFITAYICKSTLNAVQVAACSRTDYALALAALSPSIEHQLSEADVLGQINIIAAEVKGTERIIPAVVFGVCVVLGFLAEANLRKGAA